MVEAVKVLDKEKSATVTAAEMVELVDEYVSTIQKIKEFKDKLEPLTQLKEFQESALLEQVDSVAAADEEALLVGNVHNLKVSKKSMVSKVKDKPKLLELLGDDTYLELAEVKIGDIRKYLTPDQIEQVLKETRDGRRSFKPQLKPS